MQGKMTSRKLLPKNSTVSPPMDAMLNQTTDNAEKQACDSEKLSPVLSDEGNLYTWSHT